MQPRHRDLVAQTSEVLYLTGVPKSLPDDTVREILSASRKPVEVDTSLRRHPRHGGRVWARYASPADAAAAAEAVRTATASLHGATLGCRFELGLDEASGQRAVSRINHNTIIRRIDVRRGSNGVAAPRKRKAPITSQDGQSRCASQQCTAATSSSVMSSPELSSTASYSSKSISVGGVEYPFPSGLYLSRLIGTLQTWPHEDELVKMVSDVQGMGNRHAKEMSEAMAVVDAVQRAIKRCLHVQCESLQGCTRVFVVGDGKVPLGAATLALHFPRTRFPQWSFVSIDPLLGDGVHIEKQRKIRSAHNLTLFSGMSQDYNITRDDSVHTDIVVACHSHAPLEEFWQRLDRVARTPPIAVVLPCCADFSNLPSKDLVMAFEDFEVYSPKRTVKIYRRARAQSATTS
mmetsp:Transcript_34718/g.50972  ORF Transcript_34718/g.50972 Transcript_34718/m.50972 type:complete len:404 (+) Transcript_34718:256-1467(+)